MTEITPKQLKQKFVSKELFILLDVRTNDERNISSIDGAVWILMDEIEQRFEELDTPQIPPVCIEPLVDKSVMVFVGVLKNHCASSSHATGVERGAIATSRSPVVLDKKKEIIVHCHHGMRSEKVAAFLRTKGFDAKSLKGGIDAWSEEVDNSVQRY